MTKDLWHDNWPAGWTPTWLFTHYKDTVHIIVNPDADACFRCDPIIIAQMQDGEHDPDDPTFCPRVRHGIYAGWTVHTREEVLNPTTGPTLHSLWPTS